MSRKPCTYTKQIWADRPNQTFIYIQKESGEVKGYFVTHQKQHIRTFLSLDAAQTFAKTYKPTLNPGSGSFAQAAADFNPGTPYSAELDFRLLIHLYLLSKPNLGDKQKIRALQIGALVSSAGFIPYTEAVFFKWVSVVAEQLAERTTQKIKTQNAIHKRYRECLFFLKVIKLNPIEFKKWLPVLNIAEAKLKQTQSLKKAEKLSINSYSPFTLKEINNFLAECKTFPEVSCLVLALSTGLRSGEFEKVRKHHIKPDGSLDLNILVTKTKVKHNPQTSVATKISALYSQGEVKVRVEKKRFRPTAAVNLIQANTPILTVSQRLGHANIMMITNHYAKQLPADWVAARTSEEYLGIGELKVGDWVCLENAWDKWCLRLLLMEAKRFGVLEEVKERLLDVVGERKVEVRRVDAF